MSEILRLIDTKKLTLSIGRVIYTNEFNLSLSIEDNDDYVKYQFNAEEWERFLEHGLKLLTRLKERNQEIMDR